MTADQIKALRLQLGLTQEAFGQRLGVAQNSVAQWESGYRQPSGSALILLRQIAEQQAEGPST